jgi:hypothetical protein
LYTPNSALNPRAKVTAKRERIAPICVAFDLGAQFVGGIAVSLVGHEYFTLKHCREQQAKSPFHTSRGWGVLIFKPCHPLNQALQYHLRFGGTGREAKGYLRQFQIGKITEIGHMARYLPG